MAGPTYTMIYLAVSFFLCSLVYSMAGFGGGSTYIALLILFNVPFDNVPTIALICNIIVVTSGLWNFHKEGHFEIKLLLPFIVTSIPMAYVCGSMDIGKTALVSTLAISLTAAGLKMLFQKETRGNSVVNIEEKKLWGLGLSIGGFLGGLAGLTGIGGGIFLAPTLYLLKWGLPKQIAATSSAFIFLNSVAGLMGQLGKQTDFGYLYDFLPLCFLVFIGGQIGGRYSSEKATQNTVRRVAACIILIAAVRLSFS